MERAFTTERVESLAEVTGNLADHGPQSWGDSERAKLSRRHEPHSCSGHRDGSSIFLKVAELVNGGLERSVRVSVWLRCRVGKPKWRLAKTGNAVGRCYLARQGLQGIQPLIRVLYLGLKLAVLLLKAVLLTAQRIVI